MAEFNPAVPDMGAPDYTGVSRGGQADKSTGIALAGAGDLFGGIAKVADNYVQNDVQVQAQDQVAQVNQKFGFDPSQAPPEITSSQTNLQRLAAASAQGKITPEYYYQQLAMTTKSLRARYPGYEDYVDQAIQKITGMNPANEYRNALIQNINQANANSAGLASKDQTYIRDNGQYVPPDMLDDYLSGGGKYTQDQVVMAATKGKALAGQQELLQKQSEFDTKNSATNYSQAANLAATNVIQHNLQISGFGGQSFSDVMTKIAKGGGADPGTLAQLQNQLMQQYNAVNQQLTTLGTQAGYNTVLAPQQADIRKAALQPLADLQDQLKSGNYSAAALTAAQIQLSSDQNYQAAVTKDPTLGFIKDVIGRVDPTAAGIALNNHIQSQGGLDSFVNTTMRKGYVAGSIEGTADKNQRINSILQNSTMTPADKTKAVQNWVGDFSAAAGAGDFKTPDEALQFAKNNYGTTAQGDTLWQSVKPEQKSQLFTQLYNPQITQKILKSGNAQAFQVYEQSAADRFMSIPEFSQAASSISQGIQGTTATGLTIDPKTGMLNWQVTGPTAGFLTADEEAGRRRQMGQFIDTFNKGVATMQPIYAGAKIDPVTGTQMLLKGMGQRYDSGANTGFYYSILKNVDQYLAGQTPDAIKNAQAVNPQMGVSNLKAMDAAEIARRRAAAGLEEHDTGESPGTQSETPVVPDQKFDSLSTPDTAVTKIAALPGTGNQTQSANSTFSETNREPLLQQSGSDPALEELGRTETKTGNYNAVFAGGKYGAPDKPVTDLSLDEAIDVGRRIQQTAKAESNGKFNAGPLGKFQFVSTTLQQIKSDLGLSGQEKMTPELQNRMASYWLDQTNGDPNTIRARWTSWAGKSDAEIAQLWQEHKAQSGATGPYTGPVVQPPAESQWADKGLKFLGPHPAPNSYSDGGDVPAATSLLQSVATAGASRPDAVSGLQPAMRTRLAGLLQAAPPDLQGRLGLFSGYRSVQRQTELYNQSNRSGRMVASPGGSQHNWGSAVDLSYKNDEGSWVSLADAPSSVKQWVSQNVEGHNLKLPMSYEPWHVELAETRNFGYVGQKSKFGNSPGAVPPSGSAFVPPATGAPQYHGYNTYTDPRISFSSVPNDQAMGAVNDLGKGTSLGFTNRFDSNVPQTQTPFMGAYEANQTGFSLKSEQLSAPMGDGYRLRDLLPASGQMSLKDYDNGLNIAADLDPYKPTGRITNVGGNTLLDDGKYLYIQQGGQNGKEPFWTVIGWSTKNKTKDQFIKPDPGVPAAYRQMRSSQNVENRGDTPPGFLDQASDNMSRINGELFAPLFGIEDNEFNQDIKPPPKKSK